MQTCSPKMEPDCLRRPITLLSGTTSWIQTSSMILVSRISKMILNQSQAFPSLSPPKTCGAPVASTPIHGNLAQLGNGLARWSISFSMALPVFSKTPEFAFKEPDRVFETLEKSPSESRSVINTEKENSITLSSTIVPPVNSITSFSAALTSTHGRFTPPGLEPKASAVATPCSFGMNSEGNPIRPWAHLPSFREIGRTFILMASTGESTTSTNESTNTSRKIASEAMTPNTTSSSNAHVDDPTALLPKSLMGTSSPGTPFSQF